MAERILERRAFIHGRLYEAGEKVELDAREKSGVAPAPSTPIGNMTIEQLRAALERAESKEAEKSETHYGYQTRANDKGYQPEIEAPIADITVRSPGTSLPQGVPPEGKQTVGGKFVFPSSDENIGRNVATAGSPEKLGNVDGAASAFDHDGDGEPGGSLTKAEIVEALQDRAKDTGEKVDTSKTKAELQKQLSTPPA